MLYVLCSRSSTRKIGEWVVGFGKSPSSRPCTRRTYISLSR